jgi:ZIP family zinc transporter
MSFAAGAMIFVVIEELIPESHRSSNRDLATLAALTGFVVMMVLDLAFR